MSSRIPSDLLLASPEEAADKLATYMVLSRQAGGFTKSAAPWYEDVGNSVSDFWAKNVAGPAQSFGETAGGTFSEYWDKYVDSITGGGGPAAQTLALAGTGAGIGGIYGLVSELARNKKERRWENPLLYAGLGGAIGGGAGLAYHNIPGLRDTVDETVNSLRGEKRPPPSEVDVATAVSTPEAHRTPEQQRIVNDVDEAKTTANQELARGVATLGTDPNASVAVLVAALTGEPSPEALQNSPYLSAIAGTGAGIAVSKAVTSARGLRQLTGEPGKPSMADRAFGGVPSVEILQRYLGSSGGINLDDATVIKIQNELRDYANSWAGRTRGRLPRPAGGMPTVWHHPESGNVTLDKPSRADRAARDVKPWRLESGGFVPGQQKIHDPGSIAPQLVEAYKLEKKVAEELAAAIKATGAERKDALALLLKSPKLQNSGTRIQLSLEMHPDTGNWTIAAPGHEAVARLAGEDAPPRVPISAPAAGVLEEAASPESIMRAFGINADPAGKIHTALTFANSQMAKPGVATSPAEVAQVRADLNKSLAGSQSSRRFPLEAQLSDGRWTIVETIKPVLKLRNPFGGRFGVQLPFHLGAPSSRPYHTIRGSRLQRAPGARVMPHVLPAVGGIWGGYHAADRARHRAAERAAIRAVGGGGGGNDIWDKIIELGREADKPRQRGQ